MTSTGAFESLVGKFASVVELIYTQYGVPSTPQSRQELLKVVSILQLDGSYEGGILNRRGSDQRIQGRRRTSPGICTRIARWTAYSGGTRRCSKNVGRYKGAEAVRRKFIDIRRNMLTSGKESVG